MIVREIDEDTWKYLSTILCCEECARKIGFVYARRIGGTYQPDKCPVCGKERYLGEYDRTPYRGMTQY